MREPHSAHSPKPESDGAGHYAAYDEHAKTLRTWLVAYGVGAPVLIVSTEAMWKQLVGTGVLPLVATLFLLGVGLQVLLAAVNKSAMWACYYGEIHPPFKKTRRYKVGEWLSSRYFIDFWCDILAIGLFCAATYFAAKALAF
jgi:hypothetical protein